MAIDLSNVPAPAPTVPFPMWAALVAEALSEYNVSAPTTEDDWRSWAEWLGDIPDLATDGVPSPQGFSEWYGWALAWLQCNAT